MDNSMRRMAISITTMTRTLVLLSLCIACSMAVAGPQVLTIAQTVTNQGHTKFVTQTIGLVNMDEISTDSSCSEFVGPVKVEGVQFTESGGTLQQFRFTDKNGYQWSVPTNIGKLSNAARSAANSFIRVGQTYFAHIEACGSGGFSDLIALYALPTGFGIDR